LAAFFCTAGILPALLPWLPLLRATQITEAAP